jgi:hypothetical protein
MRFEIQKGPADYQLIWKWLKIYHGNSAHSQWLPDIAHDLWIDIQRKTITSPGYIVRCCKKISMKVIKYKKLNRDFSKREIVVFSGNPRDEELFEFPSFDPEFELPLPKDNKKRHHHGLQARKVKAIWFNGMVEIFDSASHFSSHYGVGSNRVYNLVRTPNRQKRFKNKLSHIKSVEWISK